MNTTLLKHEIISNIKALSIWTGAIIAFVMMCIFMYPGMSSQMESVNEIFSSMGTFSEAFGMTQLNFGTLIGFYAVECGNILGIGGAMYAALLGINALAKEEDHHTADYLFTHPITRNEVIFTKLIAIFIEITILNITTYIFSILSIIAIGETVDWKIFTLIHLSFYLVQLEIASICFGISAFLKNSSIGIGLGLSIIFYLMNIIANISDKGDFLKYITPFGYSEASDIVSNQTLNGDMLLLGLVYSVIFIIISFIKYNRKDLR